MPVPVAGRSSKCSLIEIGASVLPRPIPMPTGQVSRTTSQTDGIVARRMPKTPIKESPSVIARRVPIRAARYAPTGAKRPMHSTGIVPSSPTTACDVPNPSWIFGIRGPTPTICGRSVRAAKKSATSVQAGRRLTRTRRAGAAEASPLTSCTSALERGQVAALARGEPRDCLPEDELLEVRARAVLLERGLVHVPLEDEEAVRVVVVAVDVVLEAARLGARERDHLPEQPGNRFRLTLVRDPRDGE